MRNALGLKGASVTVIAHAHSTRKLGGHAAGTSYQDMMDRYQMIDRARAQLREVEAALERMEQGEYGYCEKTGDPIGWRRLKANPVARLSIHAQEQNELLTKIAG